jgi:hypothetical protein
VNSNLFLLLLNPDTIVLRRNLTVLGYLYRQGTNMNFQAISKSRKDHSLLESQAQSNGQI